MSGDDVSDYYIMAVGSGAAGKAMTLPLFIETVFVLWAIMWMSLTTFD